MANDIRTISAEELYELMFTGKDLAGHDITLINVLDHDCFNDCHIKGSINIDHKEIATHVKAWDRDRAIITYCASSKCPLSKEAYQALIDMGFTDVRAYEGGMKEWHDLGYPSEGACTMNYLTNQTPQTASCPICKESTSGCLCG